VEEIHQFGTISQARDRRHLTWSPLSCFLDQRCDARRRERPETLRCQVIPIPAISDAVHAHARASAANEVCFFASPEGQSQRALSQCESTGGVGPANDRLCGGATTRDLARCRGHRACAARSQAVQAVSHDLRAQYAMRERGDEDCKNARVEYRVDARVSGEAQRLTGTIAHSQRGQPLCAAIPAHRGVESQPSVGIK